MKSKSVVTLLSRALNMLDYKIIDHGQRVAYIMYKMLKIENKYSDSELHKIYLLSALHDIGAYKTEEIDSLTDSSAVDPYEIHDTIPHSAYGYLFLRNFSMLDEYADVILYHHFPCNSEDLNFCKYKDLASKLFLADRVDILSSLGHLKIDRNLLSQHRDTVFLGSDIELILLLEEEFQLSEMLSSGKYLEEIEELHEHFQFTEEELLSFLMTLGYIIDFRSESTVLHNITTVRFSVEIAKILHLSDSELKNIFYGSLLHDVGKISTSILILEKTGALDEFEYESIKNHVLVSELILKGCVDEEILQIAIRHHEKLDGSGYPYGLMDKDLTLSEKIVGVADILSALFGRRSYKEPFPANEIQRIISDLANQNKISHDVVDAVINNYDKIIEAVELSCGEVISTYINLKQEYNEICKRYKSKGEF